MIYILFYMNAEEFDGEIMEFDENDQNQEFNHQE